jgi:ABC-2 type transport system permease protein
MVRSDSKRLGSLLIFLIGIMSVVVVNQLSARWFFRWDLTEEKRYTISAPTRELLGDLEEVVYVDVYLEGDFPAAFRRLQKAVRETLDEYKIYAGANLQYRFVNPSSAGSEKARNEFYQSLAQKGIRPTNVFDQAGGRKTQSLLFPGALIRYGNAEAAVNLLKGNKSAAPQEQLNQSIEGLEYELSSAIRKLARPRSRRIALLKGHGELDTLQTAGLTSVLLEHYQVYHVDLSKKEDLRGYDAIVLASPREAFSEADKYKIDQYIVRGGRGLFLIESMEVNLDSAGGAGTYAIPLELNLGDLFFRWGFRINQDYVIDLNASSYPVVVGNLGDQPQVALMPWPFFPLLNRYADHPVVRNLDAIYARTLSTIDTVKAPQLRRIPLVFTSEYSRILPPPVRVSVNDLRAELQPEFFQAGPQAVVWLAEGRFTSLYRNRPLPAGVARSEFAGEGEEGRIILSSDGDMARNDINPKTGQPQELGFDPFTNTHYANPEFLLNALNFLLEEDGLIRTRSKEVRIRPLDPVKTREQGLTWQLVNLLFPLGLIALFGIAKNAHRRRRYTRFKS